MPDPFQIQKLKKQTELELMGSRTDWGFILKGILVIVVLVAILDPPNCGEGPTQGANKNVSQTDLEQSEEDVVKQTEHRPHRYGWGVRRANRRINTR